MPKKNQFSPNATEDSIRQRRYNSSALQKKRRAKRNKARRMAMRSGRVRKGDGRDIDHMDRRSLSYGSTVVKSKKANRAKNSPIFTRRKRK